MTEEAKQDTPKEAGAPKEERMISESALKQQGAEWKQKLAEKDAQLAELLEFKAKSEAAQKKADEEAALKRGEFDELAATLKAEIEAERTAAATLKRKLLERDAKDALRSEGLENALALKGALADLPDGIDADGIAEWVTEFKAANADAFGTSHPVKTGSVGSPSTGESATSLEQRLKSTNPKVKQEALVEKLRMDAGFA